MSIIGDIRHGRGFGVHSPWAYNMVMHVLRQKASYYKYGAVNELFAGRKERRTARAVFRVLVSLRPESVTVIGRRQWEQVAVLSGCQTPGGPKVLIVDAEKASAAEILAATSPEGVAVIVGRTEELMQQIETALPDTHGFVLDTVRSLAFVNMRRDMPRQTVRALW